jgi:hypothetical protein
MADRALGPIINLPSEPGSSFSREGYASDISVHPTNPDQIAVCAQSDQTSQIWGPMIIRDNVVGTDYPSNGSNHCGFISESQVIGQDAQSNAGTLSLYDVLASGVSFVDSVQPGAIEPDFVVSGESVFTNNGSIYSASSLSRQADIRGYGRSSSVTSSAVAVDRTRNRAWYAFRRFDSSGVIIRCVELDGYTTTSSIFLPVSLFDERQINLLRVGDRPSESLLDKESKLKIFNRSFMIRITTFLDPYELDLSGAQVIPNLLESQDSKTLAWHEGELLFRTTVPAEEPVIALFRISSDRLVLILAESRFIIGDCHLRLPLYMMSG